MKTLVLKNNFQMNMTMLPNSFVDHYMANANGEFVKVYLRKLIIPRNRAYTIIFPSRRESL